MCEFAQKLVAWLDGELPESEAAKMERHLAECEQCRGQLEAYRQASDAFEAYSNAYGDAARPTEAGRRAVPPTRAIYGAAAIAAAIAIFFVFTARVRHSRLRAPQMGSITAASEPVQTAQSVPTQNEPAKQLAAVGPLRATPRVKKNKGTKRISPPVPDRRIEASHPQENTDSMPGPAAVEIAIPADAIFPPGAVPAGMSFTADVTMASDGSAEQIRLRPQLTEFERRGNQ